MSRSNRPCRARTGWVKRSGAAGPASSGRATRQTAQRAGRSRRVRPAEQVVARHIQAVTGVDPGLVQRMPGLGMAMSGAKADLVVRPPQCVRVEQRVAGDGILPEEMERRTAQDDRPQRQEPAAGRPIAAQQQVDAVQAKRQRHRDRRQRAGQDQQAQRGGRRQGCQPRARGLIRGKRHPARPRQT